MTGTERIDAIARKLFDDRAQGRQLAPLVGDMHPEDLAQAYAVQDRLQALYAEAGWGAPAGWKIALTTPTMQAFVGVDHPCAGAMLAAGIRHSPAEVRAGDFVRLGVESEIAVRLDRDLGAEGAPYDRGTVAGAVDACMAAIETVDDQDLDYSAELDAALIVAGNALNFGCVLGPPVEDWRRLDLASLAGRMTINGETVGEGSSADVLGHPLNALAWLANNLIDRGKALRAGDVVLTGSIVTTKWLVAGDDMAAEIDGLGEARLKVV